MSAKHEKAHSDLRTEKFDAAEATALHAAVQSAGESISDYRSFQKFGSIFDNTWNEIVFT